MNIKSDKPTRANTGNRGGRKTRLTEGQKIRLGHGRLDSIKPVGIKLPWRGVASVAANAVFDRNQVEVNKALYPHLFGEDYK